MITARISLLSALALAAFSAQVLATEPAPASSHGGMLPQYRQTLKSARATCQQQLAAQKLSGVKLKQALSQCRKS